MKKPIVTIISIMIPPIIYILITFVFNIEISLKSNMKNYYQNKEILINYINFNEIELDYSIRELVRDNIENKDLIRKINNQHIKLLNLRDLYELLYNGNKDKINNKALEIKKITAAN